MMPTKSCCVVSLLLAGLLSASVYAADTIYKCTNDQGDVTYVNDKQAGVRKGKKCVVLSVYVPPPPSSNSSNGVSSAATGKAAAKTPTPADFPRVSGDDQKSRDGDRRAILDRELALEQANLEKARVPTPAAMATPEAKKIWQDSIALHERNIEALNKEIARLR